ncbi:MULTISPECIES: imidazole glycerol phosphate synthase subunit HisF [unclassified Thermotoga]|uniref:imidazole glycerol phosphate synthase subunit HisF n=1 Tax=unclassified Thermotoga TaxID=2631113 RepID=UPI000541F18C|nr:MULTISPECIES: imidazole glycerol phosphate synthase subunit HisF [unclassified Thermotoga]KAF2959171.1 imidazole glycerol phosphate synthase cyclase subunit [Thermotoga sp. 38H-to]KHC90826.1 imidazole glycerol phosphate synthase subunit HisF [Thermotoga sp. Mc24]
MLAKRIIACLDVKDGRVVKGTNFENLRDSGDPVELGKFYSEIGIDELVFLDITASVEKRKTMLELVEKVAEQIDIPFTVGGGIHDFETASELILRGADKVSINTAAVEDPSLITKIARTFGSQAVVVAIDAKRVDGEFVVFTYSGKKNTGILLRDWVVEVERRGAGEILLTSIDRDGTKAGYDTEMIRFVRPLTTLPIIASGGAGKMEHFLEAFLAGADAALAASVFHFREIDVRELKEYLKKHGVNVRLEGLR